MSVSILYERILQTTHFMTALVGRFLTNASEYVVKTACLF